MGASIRLALQEALQTTLIGPFQTSALFLLIVGVALLVLSVYLFVRARRSRALPPAAPKSGSSTPELPPASDPAPAALDDEQPFPPSA